MKLSYKISLISALLLFSLLFSLNVISAKSVKFTISADGINTITVPQETVNESCNFNNETNTTECINQTIVINQTSTKKWSSSQEIEVDCELSCNYQIPTFITPETVEIKNYTLDYDKNSDYMIVFEKTNSSFTKDKDDRIHITIKKPSPELVLQIEKIVPKNLTPGITQVNILVKNLYDLQISSIDATISGQGISTLSSIPIQKLMPGERDYVFVSVNVTETGTKDVIIKLNGETPYGKITINHVDQFFISSSSNKKNENTSEIIDQLDERKNKLKEYESIYLEKKAQGFLVSEVYDMIKETRENIQKAQIAALNENIDEAKKYLLVIDSELNDIMVSLQNAKKETKSIKETIKENAIFISTVIAAFMAILGLIERQRIKMKKLKDKLKIKELKKSKLKNKK